LFDFYFLSYLINLLLYTLYLLVEFFVLFLRLVSSRLLELVFISELGDKYLFFCK
jgi:hypothetical protein